MPLSVANIFRLLVTAVIALHVFWMYSLARTINASFGFRPGVVIAAAFFALVMIVPLVWAVAVLEIPEMIAWFRGQRRWRAGRCPACDYRAPSFSGRCPECSGSLAQPAGYRITIAALRRFGFAVLAAWIIGTIAAESWILHDEHRVREEVGARGDDETHIRDRRWPGAGSLVFQPHKGFAAIE